MFLVEVGLNTYEVSYADNQFAVKAVFPDGNDDADAIVALAEISFLAVKARGEYAPTAGMIEYYTAQEMGVEMETPDMDSELDVVY
jgi:hypothetical protein